VAVRIRLTRVGATKQPSYRFVVADSRNARDGRSLATLGHYNPRTDPIEINVDEEKARDWMSRGAKPSDTVARLFRRVGLLPEESAPVQTVKAPKSDKQTKKAKAAAAPAPAAAPPAAETAEPAEAAEATEPVEAAETADETPEAPAAEATEEAPESPTTETADATETDGAETTAAEEK